MKMLNMAATCLLLLSAVITLTSATVDCGNNNGGCEHGCDSSTGTHFCTCRPGFTLNTNNLKCDYGNCSTNNHLGVCDDICTKVTGSGEVCNCKPGFTLNVEDGKTCEANGDCDSNDGLGDCAHICTKSTGSDYDCTCRLGFTLNDDNKTCDAINDCDGNSGLGACAHSCYNSTGSNVCHCRPGFTLNGDGKKCDDINECAPNAGKFVCDHVCTNTDGSYECSCDEGYTLDDDNKKCTDINECLVNNGDCEHNCTNTAGSRNCTCNEEYSLMDDGKNCKDNTLTCYIGNGDIGYQHLPTFRNYSCCLKTVTSKPVLQSTVTYSGSKDNSTCNDYCINTLGKVSTMECTCDTNLCNAAPETLVMSVFSIFVAAFVVIAFNIFTLLSIV